MELHPLQALVDSDWTPRNLLALRHAIWRAYVAVARLCDPALNPFFGTPNRPFGLGYNRWLAVDHYLYEAAASGSFEGITARWIALGGNTTTPLSALELRGAVTSVVAVHLRDPNETPRDSGYRFDLRASNQRFPRLAGFEDSESDEPLNLLLVHGDKDAEFAELRAYDDESNRGSYTPFSLNIMAGPAVAPFPVDAETVAEPNVSLLRRPKEDRKPSPGA